MAQAATPSQSDDGGFGSVDALLLKAFGGQGKPHSFTGVLCGTF